ncbi:MAG: ABC transporter permease, partial [Cytophagales bacterium]
MFELDQFQEIYQTVSRHKLRTALTAFGVFWGIFMLVLLLGAGKGLENGALGMFGHLAKNSIWVWGGRTTVPYSGLKPGRTITFSLEDIKAMKRDLPELNYVAPGTSLVGNYTVNYQNKYGSFRVGGDFPDINNIRAVNVLEGRFLNQNDIDDARKVAIIGTRVVEILFDKQEAIGKYIEIKGVFFQVVGVFEPFSSGGDGRNDAEKIFIPLTTLHKAYNMTQVTSIAINPKKGVDPSELESKVKQYLANRHKVS